MERHLSGSNSPCVGWRKGYLFPWRKMMTRVAPWDHVGKSVFLQIESSGNDHSQIWADGKKLLFKEDQQLSASQISVKRNLIMDFSSFSWLRCWKTLGCDDTCMTSLIARRFCVLKHIFHMLEGITNNLTFIVFSMEHQQLGIFVLFLFYSTYPQDPKSSNRHLKLTLQKVLSLDLKVALSLKLG